MGWGTFDEARAWQEIASLLKGQWEDGLIPHIVFHAPSDDYFPGPDVWGIARTPPTSGITQPPVLATAVRHLWDHARDRALAEANAAAVYPALLRNHRWWQAARDPERRGLVATLHPVGDRDGQLARLGRGAGARAHHHRRRRSAGATPRRWTPRCARAARITSASSTWSICSATPAGTRRACWPCLAVPGRRRRHQRDPAARRAGPAGARRRASARRTNRRRSSARIARLACRAGSAVARRSRACMPAWI